MRWQTLVWPLTGTCLVVVASVAALNVDLPKALAMYPTPHLPVMKVQIGNYSMNLWVATTPEEQARGLMGQPNLGTARTRGMLFLFPHKQKVTFWMKNTPEPLRLLWILHHKVVKAIDMPPCLTDSCPLYPSPGAVDAAIELSTTITKRTWVGKGAVW